MDRGLRKKFTVFITIIFVIAVGVLHCSFTNIKNSFNLKIYDDNTVVLNKEYQLNVSSYEKIIRNYDGNFAMFYEKNKVRGNADIINDLSSELLHDINQIIVQKTDLPIDAIVHFNGDNFIYKNEKNGKTVDQNKLVGDLFYDFGRDITLSLSYVSLTPKITADILKENTKLLAKFTTFYESSSEKRAENIFLSAKKICGFKLLKDEIFSFNATVGDRTAENGFQPAKVILNGKFIDGIGGGVCQTSTTLYNCALLAGMEIVESQRHSLPISYCKIGTDAMVSTKSDLKFKNPYDFPIYISSKVIGRSIEFRIFGQDDGYKRVVESHIIREIYPKIDYEDDSTLMQGNETVTFEPKVGYVTETYLKKLENDKLISNTKIRTDLYLPQNGIIKRGTGLLSSTNKMDDEQVGARCPKYATPIPFR